MQDYIEQYIQGTKTFEELVEHAVEELYQSGCGPGLEAAAKVYETATSEIGGM
jgi:hypothetical protein